MILLQVSQWLPVNSVCIYLLSSRHDQSEALPQFWVVTWWNFCARSSEVLCWATSTHGVAKCRLLSQNKKKSTRRSSSVYLY